MKEKLTHIKSELPPNVKLVAVSKYHPLEAIQEAYEAGQRVFAESRPQELAVKVAGMRGYLSAKGLTDDIEWHFIGHLQTNKLKLVLPYVALVQSVDSLRLLEAINAWAKLNARTISVLLEYHIAAEESKQGFDEGEILDILCSESKYDSIVFCGLMAMATYSDDEAVIRGDFAKLTALNEKLQTLKGSRKYPNLTSEFRELSFGMSGDYKIAVEMGSTMVRLGTILFGSRS